MLERLRRLVAEGRTEPDSIEIFVNEPSGVLSQVTWCVAPIAVSNKIIGLTFVGTLGLVMELIDLIRSGGSPIIALPDSTAAGNTTIGNRKNCPRSSLILSIVRRQAVLACRFPPFFLRLEVCQNCEKPFGVPVPSRSRWCWQSSTFFTATCTFGLRNGASLQFCPFSFSASL